MMMKVGGFLLASVTVLANDDDDNDDNDDDGDNDGDDDDDDVNDNIYMVIQILYML